MLLNINPHHPEGRKIRQVVETLESGGVVIYPTDTVYALGCAMDQQAAVERICRLRRLDPARAMLSVLCRDISQASDFTRPLNNAVFRLMKRNLPGPFTFVLNTNNKVPKLFKNKKRTIGVRVPDHPIAQGILEALGEPMLTASLKTEEDDLQEYYTDPERIHEVFGKRVDLVIDGGPGGLTPSTLVFCTADEPELIRQGAGELIW
jgi:tRNA threonylcarbamoyl adenosine modification protein (Sua5/YciO/YrdC/YwlC family)